MRIIGDIHQQYDKYFQLIKHADYTLQVGDMGFNYHPISHLGPEHKFIFGNHDKHPDVLQQSNCLGKFGYVNHGNIKFFFVSGAWSIDYKIRIENKNWWKEEELSYHELETAIDLYEAVKPDIVITHCPPQFIVEKLADPTFNIFYNVSFKEQRSRTGLALETMWEIHQPSKWIFGHMHRMYESMIGKTRFICVNQYDCIDIY